MFFDIFEKLCNSVGKTASGVCNDIGIANASVAQWRRGRQPSPKILLKIADYFNVSVDYLLGKTEVSEADNANALLSSQEAELLKMFRQLNELQKAKLLISAEELLNK